MSSPQPPDPSSTPDEDAHNPGPDDDTGPVRAVSRGPDTHMRRFDAPLSVTPRPVQRRSVPKAVPITMGVVVAVAVIAGLASWLLRPSPQNDAPVAAPPTSDPTTTTPPTTPVTTTRPDDSRRLMQILPRGYPPGACEAVDAPENVLAQVNCAQNVDQDGPQSAAYTLVEDSAALDVVFNDTMQTANQVVCPGNIQSPVLCPTGVSKTFGEVRR